MLGVKKLIKRLLSYFIVFVTLLGIGDIKVNAVKNEYWVNIAVLCENLEKGQELIDKMCMEKCALNPLEMSVDLTGEKNPGKNTTELYVGYNDTNYHVRFHLINGLNHSILKKCSGAIILYDISDSTLDPIVHSGTYMSSDIKRLMSTDTPLVKYIKKLQYSWPGILSFVHGWYNAITFVTYGKEKLDPIVYDNACLLF